MTTKTVSLRIPVELYAWLVKVQEIDNRRTITDAIISILLKAQQK